MISFSDFFVIKKLFFSDSQQLFESFLVISLETSKT